MYKLFGRNTAKRESPTFLLKCLFHIQYAYMFQQLGHVLNIMWDISDKFSDGLQTEMNTI